MILGKILPAILVFKHSFREEKYCWRACRQTVKGMMNQNWSITGDHVQWVKETLKGRRAAIEAELAAIDSDIDELETFERAARALVTKHFLDGKRVVASREPAVGPAGLLARWLAAKRKHIESPAVAVSWRGDAAPVTGAHRRQPLPFLRVAGFARLTGGLVRIAPG
jgi:hypothetical protein